MQETLIKLFLQRWKSKTYRAATILSALSYLEANYSLIGQFLPLLWRPVLWLVWPAVMLTLREVTTTALSEKTATTPEA